MVVWFTKLEGTAKWIELIQNHLRFDSNNLDFVKKTHFMHENSILKKMQYILQPGRTQYETKI